MARDPDKQLLESVETRRARLTSAFLHGDLAGRRNVSDNMKRLVGSIVLAAVACAGCAGYSFVQAYLGGLGQ
jgi:cation transporter-like permease